MSCDPERVTGFVDGELSAAETREIEVHLESCQGCREQADSERRLRGRLAALPAPPLPSGLEARVRSHLRRRPLVTLTRWALHLAAALLVGVTVRGYAPFVAWELARDHDHCFSRRPLPAKVWSSDPSVVSEWFARQGTLLPALPAHVAELDIVGARYCPQPDLSQAPHVYYTSGERHASVFLVPHSVRFTTRFAGAYRGHSVRLLRVAGATLAIVAEGEADARALEAALGPVVTASVQPFLERRE
jgi:anti-sigma factor RsiW